MAGYHEAEQEVIILNAIWSIIDDMVNFANFMPVAGTVDTNVVPKSSDTLRLFHVLLGDLLSPIVPKGRGKQLPFGLPQPPSAARSSDLTFLYYLREVAMRPRLNSNSFPIQRPVDAFGDWLEQESRVEGVWLPSVGVETTLVIPRITWLKITADIGKHNFARLESNVRKIVAILARHGHEIDEGMGYAVLPEFWDWFHTHVFAYHASTICEFLNNIRWGLYEYLKPEFARAYHVTCAATKAYSFNLPAQVTAPIAKSMYWELMNRMRSPPYFPRFSVTSSLKRQF